MPRKIKGDLPMTHSDVEDLSCEIMKVINEQEDRNKERDTLLITGLGTLLLAAMSWIAYTAWDNSVALGMQGQQIDAIHESIVRIEKDKPTIDSTVQSLTERINNNRLSYSLQIADIKLEQERLRASVSDCARQLSVD